MTTLARIGCRTALVSATALVIVMGVATVRARADVWNKRTIMSLNQPVQVEDTYLEPGTYVFKLLDSQSNRHIVQIYNREENHLINTFLAIPNYRLEPTDGTSLTFYETPPGTAHAVRAWFYPGDNYGQEFRYPKQLRQIAMATPPRLEARPPEPPPPPIVTEPAEPEQPAPSGPGPQASTEPEREPEPQLEARNEPAPEPAPAPAQAPEPKAEEPKELPATATWFPVLGLGGGLCLAAFLLLRVNRVS